MTNTSADFTIEYATGKDMPQLLRLAHDAFSNGQNEVDFPKLLPKLYGEGENSATQHLVLRHDGNICAMLCMQILTIVAGDSFCKAGYIGTVSVARAYRGRGYMQALLCAAQQELRAEGCALGVLGGQRQRYEYFGFEPAGCMWNFTLTRDNVRHACKSGQERLCFAPLGQKEEWVSEAKVLHDGFAVHCARNEDDFCNILSSWQAKPLAILCNDLFCGYCSISYMDGQVTLQEISLADKEKFPQFCNALFAFLQEDSCNIVLPAIQGDAQSFFAGICDYVSLSANHSFAVYDWCAALQPFLQLRCAAGNVQNGNVCVEIKEKDNSSVKLQFFIFDGSASVTPVENAAADISLSRLETIQLFFAPHSPLINGSTKAGGEFFPLPLYVAAADGI